MAVARLAEAQNGGQPPDLIVTRLQGTRATAAPAAEIRPTPGPGVPSLVATRLDDRQAAANLDGPRRITLSISKPMAVGDLLLLLVNGTPFSLVTDNDVGGTFTGDLKDLTMRQAVEAVLFPRGYDYDLQGTLIRVFPRKPSTRFFTVNYLNMRRTLQRSVTTVGSAGSVRTPATQVTTVSSSDFYDDIEKGVLSLLSSTGRVHVDRTAGLVQVTDFAERLDQVGVYLEAAQARAARQVRIDARILSVAFLPGGRTSIDWSTPAIQNAGVLRSASGNGPMGLSITRVDALTKALEEQGTVTSMATPHIVAMNNEPAVVRIGKELVYSDTATSRDGAQKPVVSVASVLDGLTLTLLAQVSADDFVQLHVSPAYATQSGESKGRDGINAPILAVHEADTVMRVRDGETILLAGFLSTTEASESRAAVVRLFAGESRTTIKSELIVLLTPRILKAASASPN